MSSIVVISGHGIYAKGIKSAVDLIVGQLADAVYIDFEAGEDNTTLSRKMRSIIEENVGADVLFLCDLLGGTPFKTAVEVAIGNEKVQVVAGCNLNAIIEVILQRDVLNAYELAELAVSISKKSAVRFTRESKENTGSQALLKEDGI